MLNGIATIWNICPLLVVWAQLSKVAKGRLLAHKIDFHYKKIYRYLIFIISAIKFKMISLSLPDSTYSRKRRDVLSPLPWCSPRDGTLRESWNRDTDLCVICLTCHAHNFRLLDPLSLWLLLAFCPACSLQCSCTGDGCQCLCGSWFGCQGHKKMQEASWTTVVSSAGSLQVHAKLPVAPNYAK